MASIESSIEGSGSALSAWWVAQSSELVILYDAEKKCLEVSQNIKELLGYTPNKFKKLTPDHWIHPDDLVRFGEMFQLAEGRFRHRGRHLDGQWIEFEAVYQRRLQAETRQLHTWVMLRRLTESWPLPMAQTRPSVNTLAAWVEQHPHMAAVSLGLHWEIVGMTPRFEQWIGASLETVRGQSFFGWVHPDDGNAILTSQPLALSQTTERLVFRLRGAEGGYRWLEALWNYQHAEQTAIGMVFYEVSPYKTHEAELLEQAVLSTGVVTQLAHGVIHLNPAGRVVLLSDWLKERLDNSAALYGEHLTAWLHPDNRPLFLETMRAILIHRHDTPAPMDFRLRGRDGDYFWVEMRLRGMRAPQGALEGIVVSVIDSAEKVALEVELATRAAYDTALTQSPHLPLLLTDSTLTIRAWSGGAAALLGYDGALVGPQTVFELLSPADQQTWLDVFYDGYPQDEPATMVWARLVLAGDLAASQLVHLRHADGHIVPIQLRLLPYQDATGAVAGVIVVLFSLEGLDVRNLYHTVLARLPLGLLVFDEQGELSFVSPTAAALLGYDLLTDGRRYHWRDLVDTAALAEQLSHMAYGGRQFHNADDFLTWLDDHTDVHAAEYLLITPDQRRRVMDVTRLPLVERGRVVGQVFIIEDTRSQKASAAEDKRLLDELQRINKEWYAHYRYIISELRKPLRWYESKINWIVHTYKEDMPTQAVEDLTTLREQHEEFERRLQGLEQLINAEQAELRLLPTPMTDVARNRLSDLINANSDYSLDLLRQFEIAEMPVVQGDPYLLGTVYRHLFDNAIKSMPALPNLRVKVGMFINEKGEQVFFVRDNGVGFSQAKSEEIFSLFAKLKNWKPQNSLGVGLAIVRSIIRRHGGRVWAKSAPYEGATFYFTIGTPRPPDD